MNNKGNKNKQHDKKVQTMHKIPVKFAEYADRYFHNLDPNSVLSEIVFAALNDKEIPKNTVRKAIEKIEDYISQELFYAMKDGEIDAKPSKEVTQMLKLLKQALTITASGKAVRLDFSETASFSQVASLKVPGGRDRFSSMRLPKLIEQLNDSESTIQAQILDLWQKRNETDKAKNFPFSDKEFSSVLRWHLRGLTIEKAVRKVRVDYEISQNFSKS